MRPLLVSTAHYLWKHARNRSPMEKYNVYSFLLLCCEIMRPESPHLRDVAATRASLFLQLTSCTDATAQQTAGAEPYQQAKEVPLLLTRADNQLSRNDWISLITFYLLPLHITTRTILLHTWPAREMWAEVSSNLFRHIVHISDKSSYKLAARVCSTALPCFPTHTPRLCGEVVQ